MKLVQNWQSAFSWYSVQVLALLAAIPVMWEQVPVEIKALIPEQYNPWIMTGLALIGMVLRLVKQGHPK